jgi:CRP-like cAMP-binding protein/ATP/ADP translocase/HEAT repeat protein
VTAMFLLYMGLISASFVVGRTAASSLFLHRLDKSLLPYTYAAVAVAVSLASALYTHLSHRVGRGTLFSATLATYVCGLLLLRNALYSWPDSIIVVGSIYVFIDVLSILCITQFWSLSCDVFSTREAKRVFSVIGGGSAVAMLLFGGLLRAVVRPLGTANLLYLMAGELVLCGLLLVWIRRTAHKQLREAALESKSASLASKGSTREGLGADFSRLRRTRHLASIAAITGVMAVAITLIDYQWKMSAREAFLGDEDGLAAYFSLYNLFVGLLAFFIQFFLTGRILEKLGILPALMMLPGALLAASAAILTGSARTVALWASTAAAGANSLLRFTVQNTTVQLFFRPVAPDFRPRAEALIEGIIKPIVTGLTGLAIAATMAHVGLRELSYPAIGLLLVWLLINVRARHHYVAALGERIRSRRLDLDGSNLKADEATVRVMRESLRGNDEKQSRSALELLRSIPERDWEEDVVLLLTRDSAALRQGALEYLKDSGGDAHLATIEGCLTDPDPVVRGAAVDALGYLKGADCHNALLPLTEDPEATVSAQAAAAILRHCPEAETDFAHRHLAALARAEEPASRIAAARALGVAGRAGHSQELRRLLKDPSPEVRVAAGRAAGESGAAEMLPHLVDLLADPRTTRTATEALVSMKESSLDLLADTLSNVAVSPLLRARIPRVLSDIGDSVCMQVLLDRMAVSEPSVRAEIAAAAGRRLRRSGRLFEDAELVQQLCAREVEDFFNWARLQWESDTPADSLVSDALEQKKRQCRKSLVELLSIAHPGAEFASIVQGFDSHRAASRSDAIELLDNTLRGPGRQDIFAVFDCPDVDAQAAYARKHWPAPQRGKEDCLRSFLQGSDKWVAACAALLIGRQGIRSLTEEVRSLLKEGNPFIVQSALGALRGLVPSAEFQSLVSSFDSDPRPLVANYVAAHSRRKHMLTIVEKVLFLKSVDIFCNIPGPVLSRVAEIAREELFDQGATVITQGEMGSGLYVVVRGEAQLTVDGVEVARLGESEFFGEMSLFDAEPTSATVFAATDLDVLKVEPLDFSDLMAERVEISHGLISVLIRRLRVASQKTSEQARV